MPAEALLIAAAASACGLVPVEDVHLASTSVRVGDVVDLACVAQSERARLGDLIIAELDPGQTRSLRRDALARLVRRRLPMLAALEGDATSLRLIAPPAPEQMGFCAFASRQLPQGAILTEADIDRRLCGTASAVSTAYDRRAHLARTASSVEAGENLGALAPLPARAILQGAPVTIAVSAGPFRIERQAHAAQDAAAGGRVFVSSEDGETFAVDFPDAAP